MDKSNRFRPARAKIKDRFLLTKEESGKQTHHIVLDISETNISYNVGDSVGIYPEHHPDIVKKTLATLGASGNERHSGR